MTTATARSARPGIGRSVPLENGENGFELGAQVLDGLGRERPARLRLQVPAAPILLDLLARPLDRVFLGVEQMLHQHDQLDLAPLIHPVAGPVLGGVQEAELALPVPQHVRLQVGELTHLADREELLNGMGDAHRQCSGLSSRSIRSATAWLGDLRLKRTSATSRAIGSSTPCRSASVTAERAVFTPSTTAARPASASSSRFPSPSSTPSWWLRDRGPVAVRMRSPIPASPAKVDGSAPSATPNRVISANTHDGVESRSGSRPLDTLTTKAPRPILPRARVMTSRTAWDGAADTTTAAPPTAAVKSPSAVTAGASAAPGRNMWFRCSRFTLSTTSGSRAQRVTMSKSPLRASRSASAVPQAPPPITAIIVTAAPLSASGTDSPSPAASARYCADASKRSAAP